MSEIREPIILTIIPARGGSRRVPRKNVAMLGRHPVLAFTILAAKKSRYRQRVVVSTEDPEIAAVARRYGAEVPFVRPLVLAEDVPTEDVVAHALDFLFDRDGYSPDMVMTLEPTAPFRRPEHLDFVVSKLLERRDCDSLVSIHKIRSGRPEWYFQLAEDNRLSPLTEYWKGKTTALIKFPASQDFPAIHQLNGYVFLSRHHVINEHKSLVGPNVYGYEVSPDDAVDINWPSDLLECRVHPRLKDLEAELDLLLGQTKES